MKILFEISYIIIVFGIILITFQLVKDRKKKKIVLKKHSKNPKYAIIIPARNESSVIENLLISINKQTNLSDTYIIVENKSDKTCRIANKYGANIYVRENIKNRKRKGYALDECFKDILSKNIHYDLYFIFDADNILTDDFIETMLDSYRKGYQIATGFRNIKNSENVITTCSGLTFTMINSLINKEKMKHNKAIIISGTGFYIDGNLIEKWHGYPFHSLTEDYELSLYCAKHNISTFYNENAEFFDEQPEDMKTSITQRTRWVKGFFEARKENIKNIKNDYQKVLGVTPILIMLLGLFMFLFLNLILIFRFIVVGNILFKRYFAYLFIGLIVLYIVLFIFSYFLIMKELDRLYISGKETIKALFFNPIFLLTYIHCFFKAIFSKEITWDRIEHKK